MNIIHSKPIKSLGYQFIPDQYLPKGKNEYYLRNQQNQSGIVYKPLSTSQIDTLVHNRNTSDNWNNILVSAKFDANLVRNCKFYGLVRIGELEAMYKEFHDFKMPVGLYNSTIISCDFGNNICIDNVKYLSHYIIADDVMIANVGELATTNHSKFGNGIIKDGENEAVRTWIEVRNENSGRSILPFDKMLPGDAYLWSSNRADDALLDRFTAFTQKTLDNKRGYYGKIGLRTVIKNCGIIKDVLIGEDAYLKGANKIKNITINSDSLRKSQVGEGCELVNGIVGFGCRIFYGVKAVRFVMASHSQLKYGARLINSYLGNNATISCCEVLNSLIFPSHEQHHNNSFLCAAMIMGQSNIAAGATIGSNHNSRSPDGEIIAGRGFWPGLCVSLKHNSVFPSYTIIAKGDYANELNIPIPFSLISNDVSNDQLIVMPAYWFMYNMYAMERNAWKSKDRDRRTEKIQNIEYDYLAPDTVNEVFSALELLEKLTIEKDGSAITSGWENSERLIRVLKVEKGISIFKELIAYYGSIQLLRHFSENKFKSFDEFKKSLVTKISRSEWLNIGSQLMKRSAVQKLKDAIKSDKITSWDAVHDFYKDQGRLYAADKLQHAYTSLLEIKSITSKQFTADKFELFLKEALATREWMCKGIYDSRAKDYSNPYRKMVYENNEEMNKVLGKLEDNSFIQNQLKELDALKKEIKSVVKKL